MRRAINSNAKPVMGSMRQTSPRATATLTDSAGSSLRAGHLTTSSRWVIKRGLFTIEAEPLRRLLCNQQELAR